MTIPRILIVAGSDSGGGAGIQADIKTVTMLGGHAMTAVTALTAQNTLGVEHVHPVPPAFVVQQMACVARDIGVDAVKFGMLGGAAIAHAVADALASGLYGDLIVFDPVMIATSGATLADEATIAAMQRLAALATLITPNLPEFRVLCGRPGLPDDAVEDEARAYAAEVGAHVLVKGGHAAGDTVVDRLIAPDGTVTRWSAPRIDTIHTHGTGCTLASAIAEGLGRGLSLVDAVTRARLFVRLALLEAPGLGAGHGPMGHALVRGVPGARASLNQVTLPATDHAASVAFYEALGLTRIVDSGDRYARFETGGGTTLSVEAADEIADAAIVYLEIADLDAAVAAARAAGIAVTDPVDQPWGWREASLIDPAGNALRLYTAGEYRRFPPWRV